MLDWNNDVDIDADLSPGESYSSIHPVDVVDTIYHVSTGLSATASAIAIVRISGPLAVPLLALLSRKPLADVDAQPPRVVRMRNLYKLDHEHLFQHVHERPDASRDAEAGVRGADLLTKLSASRLNHDGSLRARLADYEPPAARAADTIDLKAVTLLFRGPKSYTGEDIVELHVHGNPLIVRTLLETLSGIDRVRLADKGEFTRRAYARGKLDLVEVEGVHDLLHSTSAKQHEVAVRQAKGELSEVFHAWRRELAGCLAYCESVVDFGEDEADVAEREIIDNVLPRAVHLHALLRKHLSTRSASEVVKSGVRVSIFGAPNAGKSSLLNMLAGREVAIVSAVPGTTRDVVTVQLDVDGWPVVLHDTAGLRDAADVVEFVGVERAVRLAQETDLQVVLVDGHEAAQALLAWALNRSPSAVEASAEEHLALVARSIEEDAAGATAALRGVVPARAQELVGANTVLVFTKADLLPLSQRVQRRALKATRAATPLLHSARAQSDAASQSAALARRADEEARLARAVMASEGVDEVEALRRARAALAQVADDDASARVGTGEVLSGVPWASALEQAGAAAFPGCVGVRVASSATQWGVEAVLDAISREADARYGFAVDSAAPGAGENKVLPGSLPSASSSSPVVNARQREHLRECVEFLELFLQAVGAPAEGADAQGSSPHGSADLVLAVEYLRLACGSLGRIVGHVQVEELLDVIFNDFCIGK
jgi:tRNA modification GTPase